VAFALLQGLPRRREMEHIGHASVRPRHESNAEFDVDGLDRISRPSRRTAIPLLLSGTVISIQTRNSRYRVVVVDGTARQVTIKGGWVFPEETEVTVVGASDGDGEVESGWIAEGLRLCLSTDRGPVVTSPVDSITVDGADARSA
jgi:hypothetical protein